MTYERIRVQLDMVSGMKSHILEEHDFYVAQTHKRVFAQFRDMAGEADSHGLAEYKRLRTSPASKNIDAMSLAEEAYERAQKFHDLLSELRQQVILGALAGLYHQWEKELREFIEIEMLHEHLQPDDVVSRAWDDNIGMIFGRLSWPVRNEPFFPMIDACRLVVNVYKHGNGRSVRELKQKYPAYLRDPYFPGDYVHHSQLIPRLTDQNRWAQLRKPMDMMVQG